MSRFFGLLEREGLRTRRKGVSTVQVNLGKLCNQACTHCHVDAGPTKKRENMNSRVVERILELLANSKGVRTLDLTGGAPELNPHFRELVWKSRERGLEVIDRCNLTVLFEPGQEETASFLAHHGVHVVASLPCYSASNVDRQRGDGVFVKSINALVRLCALGYGKPDSGLLLDLVYNPMGPFLPPSQKELEDDYRKRLWADFQIVFNGLFTITNMPIKRFAADLKRQKAYESYLTLLEENFNAAAAREVMCHNMISIGWNGTLHDCDFNQMLEVPFPNAPQTIWDISSFDELAQSDVRYEDHCFGCTAGAGSSCKGALTSGAEGQRPLGD
jgi:radical SAM/Cys-rich protein